MHEIHKLIINRIESNRMIVLSFWLTSIISIICLSCFIASGVFVCRMGLCVCVAISSNAVVWTLEDNNLRGDGVSSGVNKIENSKAKPSLSLHDNVLTKLYYPHYHITHIASPWRLPCRVYSHSLAQRFESEISDPISSQCDGREQCLRLRRHRGAVNCRIIREHVYCFRYKWKSSLVRTRKCRERHAY